MIQKGASVDLNKQEALKFVLEVLKAQPSIADHSVDGRSTGEFITDMADVFIEYLTGHNPSLAK